MLNTINHPISEITTEELLENEDYILKSPVRRIHKVKATKKVKETLTDENLEKSRDTCSNVRNLEILELLISTDMRVGELTRLNIADMNFQERSCIVLGKGNSEREVYFSAKSKMYIKKYLETRKDNNEALFVSLIKPYNRYNNGYAMVNQNNVKSSHRKYVN